MSDYHGRIINLPINWQTLMTLESDRARLVYKIGHRDARHAAAQIAIEADQLREILRRIIASADECDTPTGAGVPLVSIDARLITEARELLK